MVSQMSLFARGLVMPGLAAVFLSACSNTQEVARQQMMAPANMELAVRGDVALVEFTGDGGAVVSDQLSASLERVRLEGRPVFDVHGPIRLHAGRSAAIGNVDPAEALDFARSVESAAVLMGQTTYDSTSEMLPPQTTETCKTRNTAGECIDLSVEVRQCVEITVSMEFAAQAMDTETGATIYESWPARAERSTTECLSSSDDPTYLITRLMNDDFGRAADGLRAELAQDAADRIHSDIAPYPETFHVSFLKEGNRLAGAEQARFLQASELIANGQVGAACEIWGQMARSGVSDPAIAYNLAACAEESGNFRAASEAYESVNRMVFLAPQQSPDGAPLAEAKYDLDDWARLLGESQHRANRRYDAEEALVVLINPPAM